VEACSILGQKDEFPLTVSGQTMAQAAGHSEALMAVLFLVLGAVGI
jgi:hypothetical protein